jgi:hypothetical protein
MEFYCDNKRHLVLSYSIENLHKMAEDLNIKRCWFHKQIAHIIGHYCLRNVGNFFG